MKVTKEGVILAAKNIGGWLASVYVADIKADPGQFLLSFVTFFLVTSIGDLYLMNKVHENNERALSDSPGNSN